MQPYCYFEVRKLWLRHYGQKTTGTFRRALYHVMCRGNQGQAIFKDDRDRVRYLDFLKESQKQRAMA